MSSFSVTAHRLTITPHPDPEVERIELAAIGGYVSVVPKGIYSDGDVAAYIPEQAIVPMEILREIGLTKEKEDKETGEMREIGGLAGKDGTRVKAARFRGVLSQGIVYSPPGIALEEGVDYSETLGISKWVPPIPTDLAGEVEPHSELRSYTDIENVKRFMSIFEPGEEVICAEKIHGSCTISSWIDGEFLVSSKGLAGKGLALLPGSTPDGRTANAYWRVLEPMNTSKICAEIAAERNAHEVTLFGELIGVQDLSYGTPKGELAYLAFDLRVDGEYLSYDEFLPLMERFEVPTVPIAYRGPFDYEKIKALSEGQSMIAEHVREGVVIRPSTERRDNELGRVILKSVGEGYLTRKGETTEYE